LSVSEEGADVMYLLNKAHKRLTTSSHRVQIRYDISHILSCKGIRATPLSHYLRLVLQLYFVRRSHVCNFVAVSMYCWVRHCRRWQVFTNMWGNNASRCPSHVLLWCLVVVNVIRRQIAVVRSYSQLTTRHLTLAW